jgi:hypothetical protein
MKIRLLGPPKCRVQIPRPERPALTRIREAINSRAANRDPRRVAPTSPVQRDAEPAANGGGSGSIPKSALLQRHDAMSADPGEAQSLQRTITPTDETIAPGIRDVVC